jgi:hypothetical protein
MVDKVSMTGETKESVLRTGRFAQWLAIIASLPPVTSSGQTRKETFWRTLLTDIVPAQYGLEHPAPEEFEHLFDSWLLSCVHCDDRPETVEQSMYAAALDYGLHWLCDLLTGGEITDAVRIRAARFKTVFSNALHVRLFRTVKGYLGIGTESCQVGDTVCIASGSRVPLILRQLEVVSMGAGDEARRHELVGAAYVHGCMHGEALRASHADFRVIEVV